MSVVSLVPATDAVLARWAQSADELRDLDAALGDGDLGITVSSGAGAVRSALESLADPAPAALLLAAGRAFAAANPSTFAALFGGGLLAAAAAVKSAPDLDRAAAEAALRALAARIVERGGAQLGDKTILDALLPSIDALAASDEDAAPAETVRAMRDAAWQGVRDTAGATSRRGRAAWVGERGAGTPDPGATAYARLLDAVLEEMSRS